MGVTSQAPAANSGDVVAAITYTPLISSAFIVTPAILYAINKGVTNNGIYEISFSWDNSTFTVWQEGTTDLGGPDGTGQTPGSDTWINLPDRRPPYVKVRGKGNGGTTTLNCKIFDAKVYDQRTGPVSPFHG